MKIGIIIILFILLIIFLYLLIKIKEKKQELEIYTKQIDEIKKGYIRLSDDLFQMKGSCESLKSKKEMLENEIKIQKEQFNTIQENIKITAKNQQELSQQAFENYCNILDKNYQEKEKDYDAHVLLLEQSYQHKQEELEIELNKKVSELDKIRATRAAAMEAQLKEKEIKEQLSFYCLSIKQNDLDDIKILERIKPQLHAPRILSMLIWSTYFQKPMTTLCNNIIGTEVKSGIYKITNQKNNLCYIGQAVDLSRRWKDHAKCGLGIDTPASNKLYQAMMEDGLWNFSFEILEECPREQLNEKEKYYINLYQSKDFGYNTTKGNN